eukprot:3311807-Prymnesium_polylepis.1
MDFEDYNASFTEKGIDDLLYAMPNDPGYQGASVADMLLNVSRGKMVMKPEFGKTVRVNISSKWADNMDCGMWGSKQNIRDWATEALLEQHNIDWSSYSFKQ